MTGPTVDESNPLAVLVAVVWKSGDVSIDEDRGRCFRQLLVVGGMVRGGESEGEGDCLPGRDAGRVTVLLPVMDSSSMCTNVDQANEQHRICTRTLYPAGIQSTYAVLTEQPTWWVLKDIRPEIKCHSPPSPLVHHQLLYPRWFAGLH